MNQMSQLMVFFGAIFIGFVGYNLASWPGALIGFALGFIAIAGMLTKGRYYR
jgi:hypothetical protein